MKIVGLSIVYTEKDMEGFSFCDVPEKQKEEWLQSILKKEYRNIKIACILLVPSMLLKLLISNEMLRYCTILYDIIILFLIIIFCYVIKLNKKYYRKGNIKSHKIVIVKKLPIETDTNLEGGTHKYYPVLGKDVINGYESICYLSRTDYEKHESNQMVECWKVQKGKKEHIALIKE